MFNQQTKFMLAVVLQVAIILAMTIFNSSILAGGTEVMLQIRPVDPRDLLRGDYVTFQYDISSVNSTYASETPRNGETVYVSLEKNGQYWRAERVSKYKPDGDGLFIRGVVQSGGTESDEVKRAGTYYSVPLHIVYGIEEYFIPEGVGRNFNFWNKNAAAAVAIDSDGKSKIKRLYVDGKVWP